MWTIEKPAVTARDSFDTCRAGVTILDLRERLEQIVDQIGDAEEAFELAGQASNLHSIPAAAAVGGVTAKEMENLYSRHMARTGSRGRRIYDQLMIAAPNDMCPFCGQRNVSTLDHTLQKADHPALAVTPINLIPCCKDCNHAKGTATAADSSEQLLNAYYDDITDQRWLYAEIVQGSPPGGTFFVQAHEDWDEVTAARVQNHFNKLQLAKLYASQAGRQFQNMRGALKEIYEAAGAAAVKDDLERRFRGCTHAMVNSWEGALYEAAADSAWYCEGGFAA